MKLIKLTRANDGSKVFINPDAISMVSKYDDDKTTIVSLIGDSFAYVMVKESPDSIVKLIELGWE